jgi:hypothetical protein
MSHAADNSPATRQWGAEQLGIGPDASSAEARTALIKRLSEASFVPPEIWYEAAHTFGVAANRVAFCRGRAFRAEAAAALRNELDDFRERFWDLDPAARMERSQDLAARCAIEPMLARQVKQLAGGLELDVRPIAALDGRPGQLARELLAQFVLRPADRAARRRAWVAQAEGTSREWSDAIKTVQRQAPKLVQLDSSLLAELADRGRFQATTSNPVSFKMIEPSQQQPVQTGGGGSKWTVIVIVIVISNLVRFAASNRSSNSPSYNRPSNRSPQLISIPKPTTAQVEKMLDDIKRQYPNAPDDRPAGGYPNEAYLRLLGYDVDMLLRIRTAPASSETGPRDPPLPDRKSPGTYDPKSVDLLIESLKERQGKQP